MPLSTLKVQSLMELEKWGTPTLGRGGFCLGAVSVIVVGVNDVMVMCFVFLWFGLLLFCFVLFGLVWFVVLFGLVCCFVWFGLVWLFSCFVFVFEGSMF